MTIAWKVDLLLSDVDVRAALAGLETEDEVLEWVARHLPRVYGTIAPEERAAFAGMLIVALRRSTLTPTIR